MENKTDLEKYKEKAMKDPEFEKVYNELKIDNILRLGLTKPFIQKGRSFINIKDDDTFEDIDRFEWADKDKKIDGYIGVYNGHKCEIKKVDKEETDVEYIVTFEEYPGLTGGGDTIGEAVEMAKEALDMWLEIKKEDGE